MGSLTRFILTAGIVLAGSGARSASSQTLTTGSISGVVLDQQHAALPGAAIGATHEPTGTHDLAVSDMDGRFQFLNLRVGGPYTVTASLSGFRDQAERDLLVTLGEDLPVTLTMTLATITEAVVVVGQTPFSATQSGTASSV